MTQSGGKKRLWQLGRNAGWLTASRAIRLISGIVIFGAIGRYLGPEQFGQLNFAIGLTTIFAAVATLGFEGIVIRELVLLPDEPHRVLGTAFILRILGALLAIALVVLSTLPSADYLLIKLALIVSLTYLPGAGDVIELWFQKNIDARRSFQARIVATIAISIFRVVLIWQKAPIAAFAWTSFIESAVGFLCLGIVYYRSGAPRMNSWRWNSGIAFRILSLTWPLILSGILVATYARIEQVLVKAVLGDYVLGIYYASIRISDSWSFVPPVLLMTIYPILVAKRETSEPGAFRQKLQAVFDLVTGIGYAIAVGTTVAAPVLIPLIFGEKYRAAVPILILQAWTAPILFSGAVRAQYFLLENLNIYHTVSAVIGIAANIGLGLWFMRLLGAPGAALAALVAGWISACGTSLVFPKLRTCGFLQMRAFLFPFRIRGIVRQLRTFS